ncbi:cupin domain-containing protein [Sphingobacterium spiritivorum]|uniref:cupin domain-containing protein n=1 Tax=Sphingobacterium spiritivorum TaxID=258 RepID=UPI003DA63A05
MEQQSHYFQFDSNTEWEDLGQGVKRKIFGYNKELMLVKVKFEKGAIGTLHRHPHVQTSFVSEGSFKYSIDGEEKILNKGDACVVPSNALHGCECLEAGELIDSFAPYREDFV